MPSIRSSYALLALPMLAFAAPEDRLAGPIENSRTFALKGHIHSLVARAVDRGNLDSATKIGYMRMVLKPSPRQAAALEQLLEDQRNPASPDYRNWLTPEEYGERFGVSQNDLSRIASWLSAQGFAVEQSARARNWIAFSGSAGQTARAFQTEIHRYEWNGESHFANTTDPFVPAAFAGVVEEIRGLHDFRPQPQRIRRLTPDFNSSSGAHYLAPDDLAAIYDIAPLYQAGFDGSGQKLVIPGQTDINLADIRSFRRQFNLPAKDPQLVLVGPDPGISSGDEVEADLDLEWSGAVARNASIVYVYSQNVFESIQYAIDQNLAPVISLSYGACEAAGPASFRSVAQQANAQGITWMNSSGDGGAAGCDYDALVATGGPSVIFPANIPEVTAVGGTEFSETSGAGWNAQNGATWSSAKGYLPEKAWNDTPAGSGIWASGGGASAIFSKPWWQTGPGVPNDQARDVPDISLSASGAHDGYLIYAGGSLMSVGGTSASSPAFAGIIALLNQYLVAKSLQAKAGVGNINPTLYALAQNTSGILHDVTAGDNIVPCTAGSKGCSAGSFGYKAGTGYDQVTGLGSVDAFNLVTKWSSAPPAVGTTTTLAASPAAIAQSASTQLTATVRAVSGSVPPTGNVTFMAGAAALGSAPVALSGTAATATLSVKGGSLSPGSNTVTANFGATGSFANSTGTTMVTVSAPAVATTLAIAASPASITSAGATQLNATVKPASGTATPGGTVTFFAGAAQLGAAILANGIATLTVSATKLAAGANNIVASYAGSAGFAGSTSAPVVVTIAPPLVTTSMTVVANPASIAQSASTVLTVTVKGTTGSVAPTGSVTFLAGNTSLGRSTLAASGAVATATLTVKGTSLAPGSNGIVASYSGSGSFAPSSASVAVVMTPPPVATSLVATASPASFAKSGSTQLTVSVKAASGNAAPAGKVTLVAGAKTLGSTAVLASGTMATATFTVPGSMLALGNNTLSASYAASGNFTSSAGSIMVTVTAPPPAATK